MSTETQPNGPGNAAMDNPVPQDRTITMTCTPTLIWGPNGAIGASVTYTQTGGEPNSMLGRVDRNGNLRLTNMPTTNQYNDNVDVYINLDTSQMVDQSGNPVAGRWATSSEYSGTGPVTGFCWFCQVNPDGTYDPATPWIINGMSTLRNSDTQVKIDDHTLDDGPSYAFCLGLVLPAYSNYYITLDPLISSKTSGPPTFMLKK